MKPADVLVDPSWVATQQAEVAITPVEVDVSPAAYAAGHVPGALFWDAYRDLRHADSTPIRRREFGELLDRDGLTPGSAVAFYGYGAHLGLWLFGQMGGTGARLMDGSRQRWEQAGYSWTTDTAERTAPTGTPRWGDDGDLGVGIEEIRAAIGHDGPVLVDVRSPEEFSGEHFWPSGATAGAGRAGHLPGAVHLPVEEFRGPDGTLRTAEELEPMVAAYGLHPDRPHVVYCTIGNRAALVAFALTRLLGFPDVRVYYGSWAEWGSRPDTPIAVG